MSEMNNKTKIPLRVINWEVTKLEYDDFCKGIEELDRNSNVTREMPFDIQEVKGYVTAMKRYQKLHGADFDVMKPASNFQISFGIGPSFLLRWFYDDIKSEISKLDDTVIVQSFLKPNFEGTSTIDIFVTLCEDTPYDADALREDVVSLFVGFEYVSDAYVDAVFDCNVDSEPTEDELLDDVEADDVCDIDNIFDEDAERVDCALEALDIFEDVGELEEEESCFDLEKSINLIISKLDSISDVNLSDLLDLETDSAMGPSLNDETMTAIITLISNTISYVELNGDLAYSINVIYDALYDNVGVMNKLMLDGVKVALDNYDFE